MAQIVSNSGYTVDQLEAAVGVIKSYAKVGSTPYLEREQRRVLPRI